MAWVLRVFSGRSRVATNRSLYELRKDHCSDYAVIMSTILAKASVYLTKKSRYENAVMR